MEWDAHADTSLRPRFEAAAGQRHNPRQRRFGFGFTIKSKVHEEALRTREERRRRRSAPSVYDAAKMGRDRVYARQLQRQRQQQEGGVRWHRAAPLDEQGAKDATEASQLWHQQNRERRWDRSRRKWTWVDNRDEVEWVAPLDERART